MAGRINYLADKPVGVLHRAADTSLAMSRTGWEPAFSLDQGLARSVDGYIRNNDRQQIQQKLESLLMSRSATGPVTIDLTPESFFVSFDNSFI